MSGGWRHHTAVGADRTVHVWPQNDVRAHVTDKAPCWCSPWPEECGQGVIVTHKDELDRWYDAELSRPLEETGKGTS